jgi:glycosyltransferase involved in cell wall biosynthesis
MDVFPKADRVDIMLLLEGTFPYVSGGVSSWVNQMVRAFPEYRFGAVFLGSRPEDYGAFKYELPANLVHLEVHFMYGAEHAPAVKPPRKETLSPEELRRWHSRTAESAGTPLETPMLHPDFYLSSAGGVGYAQFLHGKQSWEFITEMYRERCTDPSFLDYFWTVRNMHAPIWKLAAIAGKLIPAGLYHTVSTGYAGFLGALLKNGSGRPLILSEHGIYTKERRIDLLQSDWIRDNRNPLQKDPSEISYYRTLWMRFFEALGGICYSAAGDIVALFEGARLRQVEDGAPPERTMVIANGIDTARFAPADGRYGEAPLPVLSLVGRVVPIKDIKTFIRAIRVLADRVPEIQGWIVGPDDEDPSYAAECRALAESLKLGDRVIFTGMKNVAEILPQTGIMVLSSISEGLPLVILEAFAAGVPVVATDVGSCSQLVYGHEEEDRRLGSAGAVVGINDPKALAEAALELLLSPERWRAARDAAIARVGRFYTKELMVSAYRTLYEKGVRDWRG